MNGHTVTPLYDTQDMAAIMRQVKRTLSVFLIAAIIAITGIVVSLVYRSQIATIAITLVWGALTLFFWSMKMAPPLAYRKHLREIRAGLSRTMTGLLMDISPDLTFREGLTFHAVTLNIGDGTDREDDRLFYWDHQKPLPHYTQGDRVEITSHGNDIIGLRTV